MAAGVFVAALVVLLYSWLAGWTVLVVLSVAVLIALLIGFGSEMRVDRGPDGAPRTSSDRPWRRGAR